MAYQLVTGTTDLTKKGRYLHSLQLTENAGTAAAAAVLIRDTDQNGPILVHIKLVANEARQMAWSKPLYFPNGIYVLVTSGTLRGSVDVS